MDNNNIDHIPILSYRAKCLNDFFDKLEKTLENRPTIKDKADEALEKIMEIMKVPKERLKK